MENLPAYARIKQYLRNKIESGMWMPGDAVPSENQLCREYNVSRMTARRALHELSEEGLLVRNPGIGSFVAELRPVGSLMQINNIADEIASRGHQHSSRVVTLDSRQVPDQLALRMGRFAHDNIGYSRIIHYENNAPVQCEERYIDLQVIPHYLAQDFSEKTPSAYLSSVAPLAEAESQIEAALADQELCQLLEIDPAEPCLRIMRRTWSESQIVSITLLTHPGSRYRLGSHLFFKPHYE